MIPLVFHKEDSSLGGHVLVVPSDEDIGFRCAAVGRMGLDCRFLRLRALPRALGPTVVRGRGRRFLGDSLRRIVHHRINPDSRQFRGRPAVVASSEHGRWLCDAVVFRLEEKGAVRAPRTASTGDPTQP